ncbi:MAG: hypothetical protein M1817_004576 [Caeruleum heppii]|nr:MAG: hypothetical protein M1817_004576 [Caeruleum heppii]
MTSFRSLTSGVPDGNDLDATASADLYSKLVTFLQTHLTSLADQCQQRSDDETLSFYLAEWDRYLSAATTASHTFRHLDRHFIRREIDEQQEGERKEIYPIFALHLIRWKLDLHDRVQPKVMGAVRSIGEGQGQELIESFKTALQRLDDLGNTEDNNAPKFRLYQTFEKELTRSGDT